MVEETLKEFEQILSNDQIKKLQIFSDRVLQWNKYTNLTGKRFDYIPERTCC